MFRASSFNSVEHIGQTEVEVDIELDLDEVYSEWHEGVFSADNPADNAICNNGRDGSDRSSWCVRTKRPARWVHRSEEYIA